MQAYCWITVESWSKAIATSIPSAAKAAVNPPMPQRASIAVRRGGRGGAVPMAIQTLGGVMWKRPRRVLGRLRRAKMGWLDVSGEKKGRCLKSAG